MKPTCVDLFAGAGGLSSGFKRAGFEVVGALESIEVFSRTHKLNFPGCATLTAEAQHVSPKRFTDEIGLKFGPDVLIGGPPCQTFSTIGRAKIRHVSGGCDREDPRNYLFQTFMEYVAHLRPPVFVMENVPQLKTKYGGRLFERLLDLASAHNYELHIAILNSVDFGVPQNRKRLFIVGCESGIHFEFPLRRDDADQLSLLGPTGAAVRTVRDALEDLPEIEDGARLGLLPYSRGPRASYQREVRSASGLVGNNVCRVSNDRAKRVFSHMKPGDRYMDLPPEVRQILPFREDIFHDRLKRLNPEEPSWTVLAHIGMDGYMYIHPWQDRTLSVREAARLQSFDDDFTFVGNMREQYVQVGNAVPPMLASALAAQVRKALQ